MIRTGLLNTKYAAGSVVINMRKVEADPASLPQWGNVHTYPLEVSDTSTPISIAGASRFL